MKRTKPHRLSVPTASATTALQAQIIAAHGRHYFAQLQTGERIKCFPRGKRGGICVGDWVELSPQGEQAVITHVHERKNLFYRSDQNRSKQFAANIDQLLIVVASEPMFSEDLAGRALVAAHAADIHAYILLNKTDLASANQARARLQTFIDVGVPVLEVSALDSTALNSTLKPLLVDKTTLLLGQSGMGKSTLLNALVPQAQAHTQSHSTALGTGRHTTTSTTLYYLPTQNSKLIDSPGFQAFGIAHLSPADLIHGFIEFHEPLKQCKFYNCSHRHEPDCGVNAALSQGLIHPERYALYLRLLAELEAQPKY